jgi:tetratricopeptide (TPR) repeat protein
MVAIASAHGDLDVQIRLVSEQISKAPSAALLLKRANLHHQHEDYPQALSDYDRAEQLDPTMSAIAFARGRTLFESGQLALARTALNVFLTEAPTHPEALLLRARVLSGLQENAAAIRDFNRHFELAADPLPESYLERTAALVATGDKSGGLAGLDEGIRRLGNLITLQSAAIALELQLGRPEAALARVDRIIASLDRKETWLARRGEILDTAGRQDEAQSDYRSALSAIERLPAHHRDAKPMRELQNQLRLKLGS